MSLVRELVVPASGGAAAPPGAGVVPVGGIIMWSGTIATIPATWALCDGTTNAPGPDLRDTFIVGARQDDAGIAKTNIEGALSQSGGATGHSHSGHAALSHAGFVISDHTGLTHGLSIANHPDLTHAALSHPAQTITHPDHSIASVSHSHASVALAHADISLASFTGTHASAVNASLPSGSIASHAAGSFASHTHASVAGVASFASGTNRSGRVSQASASGASGANLSGPSRTWASRADASVPSGSHSHAASTITQPAHSVPSFTGTGAALTLTHGDHSIASLSHQAIGTHLATDYGVHSFTYAAHGTVAHSFTESSAHGVSVHNTVLQLPNYFALAFIQRMS